MQLIFRTGYVGSSIKSFSSATRNQTNPKTPLHDASKYHIITTEIERLSLVSSNNIKVEIKIDVSNHTLHHIFKVYLGASNKLRVKIKSPKFFRWIDGDKREPKSNCYT